LDIDVYIPLDMSDPGKIIAENPWWSELVALVAGTDHFPILSSVIVSVEPDCVWDFTGYVDELVELQHGMEALVEKEIEDTFRYVRERAGMAFGLVDVLHANPHYANIECGFRRRFSSM
jgi:hypothetical protein